MRECIWAGTKFQYDMQITKEFSQDFRAFSFLSRRNKPQEYISSSNAIFY